jgi:hypothetical protein
MLMRQSSGCNLRVFAGTPQPCECRQPDHRRSLARSRSIRHIRCRANIQHTVADVHTTFGTALEEAVGYAYRIYVIVPDPYDGLQVTKGGVFSYYEFGWPSSDRLTDEKWLQMLKDGEAPEQPEWTSSFIVP